MKSLLNFKVDNEMLSKIKGGKEIVIGQTEDGWNIVYNTETGQITYD